MPKRYSGYKGSEVVLPVNVENLSESETIISATWKKTDQVILTFQNGEVVQDCSQRNYNGRSDFADSNEGDFSLILQNIRIEDKGKYICEIRTSEKSENYSATLDVCKCPGHSLTFSIVPV